jgi:ATP phosphoribosyltransferase
MALGYGPESGTLKFYVPDGHLADGGVKEILRRAGLPFPEKDPGYIVIDDAELHGNYHFPRNHVDKLVMVLRRPHDIPKSVRNPGIHSVGITGADFIYDRLDVNPNKGMAELERMGFYDLADLGCRPANVIAAFPVDDKVLGPAEMQRMMEQYASRRGGKAVIATEFPRMTWYALVDTFGVPQDFVRIEETWGKTEQWASVRDADGVVDVAEGGDSMYRNGLRGAKPGVLMPTTPHLIARKEVYAAHEPVVDELIGRLERAAQELREEQPRLFANKLRPDIFAGV